MFRKLADVVTKALKGVTGMRMNSNQPDKQEKRHIDHVKDTTYPNKW